MSKEVYVLDVSAMSYAVVPLNDQESQQLIIPQTISEDTTMIEDKATDRVFRCAKCTFKDVEITYDGNRQTLYCECKRCKHNWMEKPSDYQEVEEEKEADKPEVGRVVYEVRLVYKDGDWSECGLFDSVENAIEYIADIADAGKDGRPPRYELVIGRTGGVGAKWFYRGRDPLVHYLTIVERKA